MNTTDIEQKIVDALEALRAGTGDPECKITSAVVPLSELGFFDSLLAIETTLALEQELGCSCGDDSIFKDKATEMPLSISEIASRLALKMVE